MSKKTYKKILKKVMQVHAPNPGPRAGRGWVGPLKQLTNQTSRPLQWTLDTHFVPSAGSGARWRIYMCMFVNIKIRTLETTYENTSLCGRGHANQPELNVLKSIVCENEHGAKARMPLCKKCIFYRSGSA